MRLAFSLILVLAAAGILLRAYFSPIRPFNIIVAAIRQAPIFIRRQWAVALFLLVPTVAAPLGTLVAQSITTSIPGRLVLALGWQFLCAAGMALVAIRIHRGLIKRERINRLVLGRREIRMVGYVLLALAAIMLIRFVPTLSGGLVQGLAFRLLQVGADLAAWGATVALCFVGPAASLDDEKPFTTSVTATASHTFAAAALVLLLQAINGLGAMGIGALLSLTGVSLVVLAAASLAITLVLWFSFIVAEHALVIALTRIRENVYEPDTRDRDHNADWF